MCSNMATIIWASVGGGEINEQLSTPMLQPYRPQQSKNNLNFVPYTCCIEI